MDALRPRFDAVRALLDEAETIVVTGHERPDGDAVGAVGALRRHLELRGKSVDAILTDPLSPRYGFMEFARRHEVYDPQLHEQRVLEADVIVLCDLSNLGRMGPMRKVVQQSSAATICFDHHPSPEGGPADINVLDPRATATGCLVYDYIRHVGGEIDREIAESVFVSLATDTGWFRYPNTTARAMELGAELAAYRLDLPGMYRAIYQSWGAPMVRLLGQVARGMNEECGGTLVWASVGHQLRNDLGVENYEVDPILDVLRMRSHVRLVALFSEQKDGSVSVSLRSRGEPDVNEVARAFGGGGHAYSAGTVLPADRAEELRRDMLSLLRTLAVERVS